MSIKTLADINKANHCLWNTKDVDKDKPHEFKGGPGQQISYTDLILSGLDPKKFTCTICGKPIDDPIHVGKKEVPRRFLPNR